jgi:hypothetical protein
LPCAAVTLIGAKQVAQATLCGSSSAVSCSMILPRYPRRSGKAPGAIWRPGCRTELAIRCSPRFQGKPSNADSFRWALQLSRHGRVIVVDNVVRDGAVLDA